MAAPGLVLRGPSKPRGHSAANPTLPKMEREKGKGKFRKPFLKSREPSQPIETIKFPRPKRNRGIPLVKLNLGAGQFRFLGNQGKGLPTALGKPGRRELGIPTPPFPTGKVPRLPWPTSRGPLFVRKEFFPRFSLVPAGPFPKVQRLVGREKRPIRRPDPWPWYVPRCIWMPSRMSSFTSSSGWYSTGARGRHRRGFFGIALLVVFVEAGNHLVGNLDGVGVVGHGKTDIFNHHLFRHAELFFVSVEIFPGLFFSNLLEACQFMRNGGISKD